MDSLWSGVVGLQEAKFLCDIVENALRQSILKYCMREAILIADIYLPDWNNALKRINREYKLQVVSSAPVSEQLLSAFTFHQTIFCIVKNWHGLVGRAGMIGFGAMFWQSNRCRDVAAFERDMKYLRDARNRIAHSKSLVGPTELDRIHKIASIWLEPIDIGVDVRLDLYRARRPGFLCDLESLKKARGPVRVRSRPTSIDRWAHSGASRGAAPPLSSRLQSGNDL